MQRTLIPMALIGTLVGVSTAYAHHSGTEYDGQQKIEIEGKLQQLKWQNPHVHLRLQSADANGRTVVWDIEGARIPRRNTLQSAIT